VLCGLFDTMLARDRVRLSCALGALLSSLMTVSDLGDLSIET
jgi:hypothetical protein